MKKFFIFTIAGMLSLSAYQPLISSERPSEIEQIEPLSYNRAKSDCPTGDCISHDISSQDMCRESTSPRQRDSRWKQGLSSQIDRDILGGKIIAYQIRWFNGNWSRWFVPGINDIDIKYNPGNNTMRRMWSYFYDHEHKYILCKSVEDNTPDRIRRRSPSRQLDSGS